MVGFGISRQMPRNLITTGAQHRGQCRSMIKDEDRQMRKRNHGERHQILHPSPWPGTHILNTARQLNERCIELLIEVSQSGNRSHRFSGVYDDPGLWVRAADGRVRSRVARCPVLLLDLNFQRVDWWTRVCHAEPCAMGHPSIASGFTTEQATPLVRGILMEAWSIARSMPHAASLVFGMAPSVTAGIARLGASDIDRIVVLCAPHLRPRWEDRPGFWKSLLCASLDTDDQVLANVHLHSLQLLGSEFVLHH